jgi:predicted RNA-binding protein with PIN domain
MPEEWLIDGYNFLYEIRSRQPKHPLAQKETLFAALADFAAAGRSVIAVLDGIGPEAELEPYRTNRFRAVYAGKLTADSYIERHLALSKKGLTTTVVTRDRAVKTMARGSGARVMDPEEFASLLTEKKKDVEDVLFKNKVKGRKFNTPFEDKL